MLRKRLKKIHAKWKGIKVTFCMLKKEAKKCTLLWFVFNLLHTRAKKERPKTMLGIWIIIKAFGLFGLSQIFQHGVQETCLFFAKAKFFATTLLTILCNFHNLLLTCFCPTLLKLVVYPTVLFCGPKGDDVIRAIFGNYYSKKVEVIVRTTL